MSLLAKNTIWIQSWMVKGGMGEEWMVWFRSPLGGGRVGEKNSENTTAVHTTSRYPDNRRLRL